MELGRLGRPTASKWPFEPPRPWILLSTFTRCPLKAASRNALPLATTSRNRPGRATVSTSTFKPTARDNPKFGARRLMEGQRTERRSTKCFHGSTRNRPTADTFISLAEGKRDPGYGSLWRVPVEGGEPAEILHPFRAPAILSRDEGLYFLDPGNRLSLDSWVAVKLLDMETSKITDVGRVMSPPSPRDFSLSPDGPVGFDRPRRARQGRYHVGGRFSLTPHGTCPSHGQHKEVTPWFAKTK